MSSNKPGTTILGTYWFSNAAGFIGIVAMNNGFEDKAYISSINGTNRDADIEYILNYGAKFPIESAKLLIGL